MTPDRIEAWEERAAILEHESGRYVSREEAEKIAAEYMKMTDEELRQAQEVSRARA